MFVILYNNKNVFFFLNMNMKDNILKYIINIYPTCFILIINKVYLLYRVTLKMKIKIKIKIRIKIT